jgi:hypothetical protein
MAVARGVAGWSALRDIATALGWPGALSARAVAWFGVLLAWAPNGRRADGDITDHRPPPRARAANARRAGPGRLPLVYEGPDDTDRLGRMVRGVFDVDVTFKPTRILVVAGPQAGAGLLSAAASRQTGPPLAGCHDRADVGLFGDVYRPQTGPPLAERHDRSGWAPTPTHNVRKQAHPPEADTDDANRQPKGRRTTSQRQAQPTPLHSPRCEQTTQAPRPTSERNAQATAPPKRSQQTTSAPRSALHDGSLGRSATRPNRTLPSC